MKERRGEKRGRGENVKITRLKKRREEEREERKKGLKQTN